MTMATTDPEKIRTALAEKLQLVVPTLEWRQKERWVWHKNAEISGALRSFDLLFAPETEVVVDDRGVQGAYGGIIEYKCDVELRVSYPVSEAELPRYLGADARDLTAILETLHQDPGVPGMFAQMWSQANRVETSSTGSPGSYIGSLRFSVRFAAPDTVTLAVSP